VAYKILIVDDEPDLELLVRQKFRQYVREGRYELTFARDGKQAVEKLVQDPGLEMVLSDINMPVMDGLTLLSKLEELNRGLKVVMVSAYGDMKNIRAAMNRGAFDFVTKPIDFQDLEITINKTQQAIEATTSAERVRQQLQTIQLELNVAAGIQLSILPGKFPAFANRQDFDLFAEITPAKEVGGDFYDFFLLDENHLGIVIGDVSGKGVPAAIFMAVARTLLRATALQKLSPGDCLTYVNGALAAQNELSMFVTLFYGILNTKTGELEFSSAGHNPPYIYSDASVRSLDVRNGVILGVMDGATFETQRLQLQRGDGILLYTDGVTEAMNLAEELFGQKQLEQCLRENGARPLQEVVQALFSRIREHAGAKPQSDDITVLTIRYLA
jgi:sigma-B regulation protein RsbU (phosphoserine phosphatase)